MKDKQLLLRLDSQEVSIVSPKAEAWGVSMQSAIRRMIREYEQAYAQQTLTNT